MSLHFNYFFDQPPRADSPASPRMIENQAAELILPQLVLCMTQHCYLHIMDELTRRQVEAGGMLLGPQNDDLVTHFVVDESAHSTPTSFTLDARGLNVILRKYRECGMNAKGLVHSHPLGCTRPSRGDLEYVRNSLANAKNQGATEFLLPIVCGEKMFSYIVRRDENEVVSAQLLLI